MLLAAMIMTCGQLLPLHSDTFSIIAKLNRQSKRGDNDSIHAHVVKAVDFEDITKGNLQKRMNNLISVGKAINKSNLNKDPYWINLGLVDITTEFALNFSHDFSNNKPTATHVDLSPSSHPETTLMHQSRTLTL